LAVSKEDIITISIVGFFALAVLILNANKLYFIAYDEEVAKVSGIKVKLLNFLLVSVVAVIISLSIRVVGTLLISALMVIPVTSALLYKTGFIKTIILSLFFSVISVIFGITLSYYFSLPSGATIVLFVIFIFIFSLIINRK
jgi:zinc transport system permease protein